MKLTCLCIIHLMEVNNSLNKRYFESFKFLFYFAEKTYNETLESVKRSFPQYIRELEGTADGAQVEFYKVCNNYGIFILNQVINNLKKREKIQWVDRTKY